MGSTAYVFKFQGPKSVLPIKGAQMTPENYKVWKRRWDDGAEKGGKGESMVWNLKRDGQGPSEFARQTQRELNQQTCDLIHWINKHLNAYNTPNNV